MITIYNNIVNLGDMNIIEEMFEEMMKFGLRNLPNYLAENL
jgi:hypothetical protein